mmetsp:Transcript_16272/g.23631  ORF Transcript_16272/g.23631 Transcript_16272/m.23631 type:complete len:231 (+) Transcript_16272:1347-2039(+)
MKFTTFLASFLSIAVVPVVATLQPIEAEDLTKISSIDFLGIYKGDTRVVALHDSLPNEVVKSDVQTGGSPFIIEIDHTKGELDEACILAADDALISAYNEIFPGNKIPTLRSAVAEGTFYKPEEKGQSLTVTKTGDDKLEYMFMWKAWIAGYASFDCSFCWNDDCDGLVLSQPYNCYKYRLGGKGKNVHDPAVDIKKLQDKFFANLKASSCEAFSDITVATITFGTAYKD